MMNQRDRDALDRHITGNYGEDQFRDGPGDEYEPDDHCESDGSGTCLIHFGRLIDSDPTAYLKAAFPDVCDASPDWNNDEAMTPDETAALLRSADADFNRS